MVDQRTKKKRTTKLPASAKSNEAGRIQVMGNQIMIEKTGDPLYNILKSSGGGDTAWRSRIFQQK